LPWLVGGAETWVCWVVDFFDLDRLVDFEPTFELEFVGGWGTIAEGCGAVGWVTDRGGGGEDGGKDGSCGFSTSSYNKFCKFSEYNMRNRCNKLTISFSSSPSSSSSVSLVSSPAALASLLLAASSVTCKVTFQLMVQIFESLLTIGSINICFLSYHVVLIIIGSITCTK
jgi:hypothetical protein